MSEPDLSTMLNQRMQGALEVLNREFRGLRAGRASSALVDHLNVSVFGASSPLNQVASVSTPESRLISINVWDVNLVPAVEKALHDSDLGLTPQTEGSVIRLHIPDLSEERRRELARVAARLAEQARIAVRNVRRDGMDQLTSQQKEGAISEDNKRSVGEKIQKLTDSFTAKIDTLLKQKQAEVGSI